MSKTKEPAFVAKTLAWCNRQRKLKGKASLKKLPKGRRRDGYSCPCGKATGLFVGTFSYGESRLSLAIAENPIAVADFVSAFDRGELPQYEL